MALEPGSRLGSYEIRELLGAGGMGEVYRAHDAKLERDVAIKVLPDGLANDPSLLERFQREAKASDACAVSDPMEGAAWSCEDDDGLVIVRTVVMTK